MLGWRSLKIGDITRNFDAKRVPIREKDREAGPYPYYGASGVVDYVKDYIFDGEFILIAEDGENLRSRKTPIAFPANGKFWVNNHAHIVQGNELSETKFIGYLIESLDVSGYLTGSTIPKLTQANLNDIPVIVPKRSDQKAIAHILGTLDDKIELNRKMNETLEEIAKAIFKSWFVDFDPVRAKMEGRPTGLPDDIAALFPDRLVDSEIGQIPEGWEVCEVADLADTAGGATPSTKVDEYWNGGEISWATPKDLSALEGWHLTKTAKQITEAGLKKISSGLLPTGTVLMSSRAPVGYLAIASKPTAINQGFIALKPKGRVSEHFLMLWCEANMGEIKNRASGTTFAEISKKAFRPIQTYVPSCGVEKAFEDLVAPMFDRMLLTIQQSELLSDLRDTLLPKLISGELKVPDAEQFLEEAGI